MEIVPLHSTLEAHDVVQGLRNIADAIERKEYDFTPNLVAVVLAREETKRDRDSILDRCTWQTHGLGEKASRFMVRGILSSALGSMSST